MARNGFLTGADLAPIGNGFYLERHAAAAFNAMNVEARRRWGRSIRVRSAYRTYSQQVYFWNLYLSGRGNLAARPGTSNHGWGLAVDLYSQQDRWMVDQIGAKYGFAKRWSDAPSEWWHIKYRSGVWNGHVPSTFVPLHYGMRGARVKTLKHGLRSLGFNSVDTSNIFGKATLAAVKRVQKKHHLRVDGIVGPKTWHVIFH